MKKLKVAWTYHTGDVSDGTIFNFMSTFECTPLVVDGVMYITTTFSRVIAIDPEKGKDLWAFDPDLDKDWPYNLFTNRGPAFWQKGKISCLPAITYRLNLLYPCGAAPPEA